MTPLYPVDKKDKSQRVQSYIHRNTKKSGSQVHNFDKNTLTVSAVNNASLDSLTGGNLYPV